LRSRLLQLWLRLQENLRERRRGESCKGSSRRSGHKGAPADLVNGSDAPWHHSLQRFRRIQEFVGAQTD